MSMLTSDVSSAIRRIRAYPGAAATAVLLLGLAVGLSTTVFSLIDTLVVRPVPFPEADRLAWVWMRGPTGGATTVSVALLRAWRESPVFDRAEGDSTATFLIGSGDNLTSREGAFVSPGLLEMLGTRPMMGRLFAADDGRAGTDDRVIVSERLWRTLLHEDPSVLDRRILIDGLPVDVVGVVKDDFRFPAWKTEIWRPLDFMAPPAALIDRRPRAVLRVADGVPVETAMATAAAAARRLNPRLPDDYWAEPRPLASDYRRDYVATAAPMVAVAAVLVLLALCANVTGLLLTRLDARVRELGLAMALGASRHRLIREVVIESAALSVGGALVGLGVAAGLLAVAQAFLPEALSVYTLNPLDLDRRAFGVASAVAVSCVVIVSLLPAWFSARVSPLSALHGPDRIAGSGRFYRVARQALASGVVAFAFMLLVAGALMGRSFVAVSSADRGLEADGVVSAWVAGLAAPGKPGPTASNLDDAVRQLPGVQTVSLSRGKPPDGGAMTIGTWTSDAGVSVDTSINYYGVDSAFFDVYRIPILKGRRLELGDPPGAVVVGERMAAMLWPNDSPLGRTFRVSEWPETHTVVGIARELHLPTTDQHRDLPEFYQPLAAGGRSAWLNIRCAPCPDVARVRHAIMAAAPQAMIIELLPVDREYLADIERPRALALLFLTFGAIALAGVAGGVFAVLSYGAAKRAREFGVRVALGAQPRDIGGLIWSEGMRVLAAGLALGAAGAWWLSKALATLLYGVAATDPVAWWVVTALLLVATSLACWAPARRSAKASPSLLLRQH